MTRYREKSTEFEAFKIGDTWPDWFRIGVDSKDRGMVRNQNIKRDNCCYAERLHYTRQ